VAPDGTLYSGSTDGTIKAWSTNDGVCVKTLEGHTEWVSSLALTPDGTLYSGSHDWSIKVWKDKEKRPKRANEGTDSETSPKAQKIEINTTLTVKGSRNGVFNFRGIDQSCAITLEGHENHACSLSLALDSTLHSRSEEETNKVWKITDRTCVKTLEGHADDVNAFAVGPDGTLYSASDDRTIKVWNTIQGTCVKTLEGHADDVNALALAPNGTLYSASDDRTIKVWNTIVAFPATTRNVISFPRVRVHHLGVVHARESFGAVVEAKLELSSVRVFANHFRTDPRVGVFPKDAHAGSLSNLFRPQLLKQRRVQVVRRHGKRPLQFLAHRS
jgi:WD40 repeat protein